MVDNIAVHDIGDLITNIMHRTGEKPANTIMTTINAKVIAIRVYSNGDSIRYRVQFDSSFDAIVKNADGEYVDGQVDYIDFVPRHLIAVCLNLVEGLDLMYTKKKEQGLRNDGASGFGAAELNVVLRNAKITLEREKFEAGSEYPDADGVVFTHEHAGYNTSITNIKVTEKIQAKLDALIDKMFEL